MILSQPHNVPAHNRVWHGSWDGNIGRSPAILEVICSQKTVKARQPSSISAPKKRSHLSGKPLPSFVVIELQTTGASPDQHEIIQIVAAALNPDGSPRAYLSTYVRPRNRVPQSITQLTGISDAALADAPTAPSALRMLARFVEIAAAEDDEVVDPVIVTLKGYMGFIAATCAHHALPMRLVRCIDSLWFYHDFLATFFAQYPNVPDISDLVDLTDMAISTVAAEPTDVVSDIEDWLGIDATGQPHPRHQGAEVRVRLFTSAARQVVYGILSDADANHLQAKTCGHDFISSA